MFMIMITMGSIPHHGIDGMMSTPSRPTPATTPGQQLRRAASATPATRGGVMSVIVKRLSAWLQTRRIPFVPLPRL